MPVVVFVTVMAIGMANDSQTTENEISIATTPPTLRQTRLAILVITILVLGLLVSIPFASHQFTRIDSLVPTFEAVDFVADLATAVLLFGQFAIIRSRALLVLASGYLYAALILACHALSYPGAFAPIGLFQTGIQATPWLYTFWRFGFSATVLSYVWMENWAAGRGEVRTSPALAIRLAVAAVVIFVCTLTWVATVEEPFLPRLLSDVLDFTSLANEVSAGALLISSIAFVWLAVRRTSVLDLWLMVAMSGMVIEQTLGSFVVHTRFSFGYYFGRGLAVFVSVIVLVALLSETTKLYARLARSNRNLQRERASKLINVQAAIASTIHQLSQPLTGISTRAAAAKRILAQIPPDIAKLDRIHDDISRATLRANEVLESMRALFEEADQPYTLVNVNELSAESLQLAQNELEQHEIATSTQLAPDLPLIMGHKGQLEEAILNLVRNSIDAMEAVPNNRRALSLETKQEGRDKIVISVQDTGLGIEQEKILKVFDPFFTTKTRGTGLGLAIARMIIERHGGRISVTSYPNSGARFEITLPVRMTPREHNGDSRSP